MELQRLVTTIQDGVAARSAEQDGANDVLLDSIERLRRAVEPPAHQMYRIGSQILQNVTLLMAEEMGLIEAIVAEKGEAIKLEDLSRKTGYDENLIARTMRLLTAIGVCDETEETSYRSNELAEIQTQPVSKGGIVLSNDLVFPIGAKIKLYLRESRAGRTFSSPGGNGPFEFANGISVWDALKQNAELKKAFDDNLAGRSKLHPVRWHDKYPAASKLEHISGRGPENVLIVDVGGNQGYDLISFQKQNPNLPGRLILQDLPETLARINLPLQCIETMAHDFFTPQPVRGAPIYYLHSVCHDWPDRPCREILTHTAEAMGTGSRLLIDEIVLENVGESIASAQMDILMFLLCNGMERSLSQWEKLLASTTPSLRIIKVWGAPGERQSIIEAALRVKPASLL